MAGSSFPIPPDAAHAQNQCMDALLAFASSLAAIIVINLMLSGDNAIVIALAARNLPQRLQKKAILFGALGAVVVRSAMTVGVVWLLQVPGLLFVGGIALIYIGYKLLIPDDSDDAGAKLGKPRGIWGAIRTIVVADMVMGVDNVLAVAGAAHGSYLLVVIGLVTSVPIVMWGSTWLLKLVDRLPVIVYIGAGVLLWTAAKMLTEEPLVAEHAQEPVKLVLIYAVVVFGTLWAGFMRNHRHLESRIHARLGELHKLAFEPPDSSGPAKGATMKAVLVPVSELPNSHLAVERVIKEYYGDHDLRIHLLHVRRPLSRRISQFVRRSLREDYHRERAALALAPVKEILEKRAIPYEEHACVGDVAQNIAEQAKRLQVHRIVMATARRGSITRILEDSTTERVLRLTNVPVELVVSDAVSSVERWGVPVALAAALAALATLFMLD